MFHLELSFCLTTHQVRFDGRMFRSEVALAFFPDEFSAGSSSAE
jgi:uncharacterized protein YbbK (DUF523 family)